VPEGGWAVAWRWPLVAVVVALSVLLALCVLSAIATRCAHGAGARMHSECLGLGVRFGCWSCSCNVLKLLP
jgi:hypothetical protein